MLGEIRAIFGKYLKVQRKHEGNQLGSDTTQFKFTAPDGKKRVSPDGKKHASNALTILTAANRTAMPQKVTPNVILFENPAIN